MERLPSGRVTRVVDNVSHEGSTWVGCDMIAVANERETGRRCQEGVSRERGVSVSLWDRRDGQLLAAIIRRTSGGFSQFVMEDFCLGGAGAGVGRYEGGRRREEGGGKRKGRTEEAARARRSRARRRRVERRLNPTWCPPCAQTPTDALRTRKVRATTLNWSMPNGNMAVVYSENLLCMRLDLVTVCDSCTLDDVRAPLAIYRLLSGSLKAVTVDENPGDTAGRRQGCKSPQAQAFGVIYAQRRVIGLSLCT